MNKRSFGAKVLIASILATALVVPGTSSLRNGPPIM